MHITKMAAAVARFWTFLSLHDGNDDVFSFVTVDDDDDDRDLLLLLL